MVGYTKTLLTIGAIIICSFIGPIICTFFVVLIFGFPLETPHNILFFLIGAFLYGAFAIIPSLPFTIPVAIMFVFFVDYFFKYSEKLFGKMIIVITGGFYGGLIMFFLSVWGSEWKRAVDLLDTSGIVNLTFVLFSLGFVTGMICSYLLLILGKRVFKIYEREYKC